tara:strand:+ start:3812 stop:4558 length:747 start_codon:yes stop_codon:yes gene_type:complete
MNYTRVFFQLFLLVTIILGAVVTFYFDDLSYLYEPKSTEYKLKEFFTDDKNCPNILVRKDGMLMLYNTNKPEVEGINPMKFYTLDDYIKHLEIQRSSNIFCPVLFLQHENDAQGNNIYRARPSPFDMQGGLPQMNTVYIQDQNKQFKQVLDATLDDPKVNQTSYHGFDAHGQHVGELTELDRIHISTSKDQISKNPMDSNWGGVTYTQDAVEKGHYKKREVAKPILFQPSGTVVKGIHKEHGGPKDIY